jgi:hypothetical protein
MIVWTYRREGTSWVVGYDGPLGWSADSAWATEEQAAARCLVLNDPPY